jgi:hypothetical protein
MVNLLEQKLQKQTMQPNSNHQLVPFLKDCTTCLSESSLTMTCSEVDCDFSFDLCFDCPNDTRCLHSESLSPLDKSISEENNFPKLNTMCLPIPVSTTLDFSMKDIFEDEEPNDEIQEPKEPRETEIDCVEMCNRREYKRVRSFRKNLIERQIALKLGAAHNSHHHRLKALPIYCSSCSSNTSLALKCCEDDCDFSFDLCFECPAEEYKLNNTYDSSLPGEKRSISIINHLISKMVPCPTIIRPTTTRPADILENEDNDFEIGVISF